MAIEDLASRRTKSNCSGMGAPTRLLSPRKLEMLDQHPGFRIAIVGGGIAGLCAALSIHHACSQQNIKIDVYEQALQYKEIGAGIGIGVNAAKIFHQIGIGDAVNSIAGDRNGYWISFRRYDTGADIQTVQVDDKKSIRQCPVHRAELLDLLVHTIRTRNAATLHNGKQCYMAKDNGKDVTLLFRDGTEAVADIVVGSDGIHSNLRSQFSSDNPEYSGRVAYRGLVPIDKLEASWPFPTYSASWLGPDKHFLVFPISRNKLLNVVAFVSIDKSRLGGLSESWTATGDRDEVAKHFEDFEETVREIISHMPESPSKWMLNDREPLDQWIFANGKVVLLGDAAHAMLPHQGAGAGQSIEDGYILARVLHDYLGSSNETKTELERWIQLYQDVRLPRAHKAQATAREAGMVYEMQRPDMIGKSFDDCLPLVRDSLKDRMKWVWTEDIDQAYAEARSRLMSAI